MKKNVIIAAVLAIIIAALSLFWLLPLTEAWNIQSAKRQFYNQRSALEDQLAHAPSSDCTMQEVQHLLWANNAQMLRISGQDASLFIRKIRDYGDFYRFSYYFGILWTDRADILTGREGLSLIPLQDGWYVYELKLPQSGTILWE